jgi:hypothetical protein
VIARYLQGTRAFSQAFRSRIIEAEMAIGQQAMKTGDVPRAMDAFNRVLSIDEGNEQVLSLVRNLGRRQQLRRISTWAMAVVSLLVVGGVLLSAYMGGSREAPPPIVEGTGPSGSSPAGPSAAQDRAAVTQAPETTATPAQGLAAKGPDKQPGTGTPPAAAVPGADRTQAVGRGGAKAEVPPAPQDPNAPRHVVLRPIPANISIGVDGGPLQAFGPSFRSVDLKPGSHTFAFQGAHECCVDEQITVNIPPGVGPYVLPHRLRFRDANLIVASNTPANVVVDDGTARGRTWSLIAVPQPNDIIGMHVVRVSAEGHRDEVRQVRLRAGQLERIEITLEKVADAPRPPG